MTQEGSKAKPKPLALGKIRADFSQEGFPPASVADGTGALGWAIVPQTGKSHSIVFALREPLPPGQKGNVVVTLESKHAAEQHVLGRFRLSGTNLSGPLPLDGTPESIVKVLAVQPAKRTPQQVTELTTFFQNRDDEHRRLVKAVAEHPEPIDSRLLGAQDLSWALLNSTSFLFNH